MDPESQYSVTPECIAEDITTTSLEIYVANTNSSKDPPFVLDPFAGCGGNVISFASSSIVPYVIACEIDAERCQRCIHNASIYNVSDKVDLFAGDCVAFMQSCADRSIPIVFLSPPWGGPSYKGT